MTHPNRYAAALAGLVLTLLFTCSPARAQVNDQAGFFSADAVRQANAIISDVQRQTRRKIVVETFPTIPADLKGSYSKDREASFYESWIQDRGKATGADIDFLIVKDPAHLEVGASSDTRRRDFTPADHHAVSTAMLAGFRAREYDRALLDALKDTAERVRRNQSGATPAAAATPGRSSGGTPQRAPSGGVCGMGGGLGGLLCLVVAGLILFSIVRRIFARRNLPPGGGYGAPGYGQPGYGQPGYGQPGYGGGGGGFGRGILGGLLGGMLGGAAYDHFRGGNQAGATPPPPDTGAGGAFPSNDVSSGGDFGSSDFSSGGDVGGGGDSGGGDVSSGGDF
jgi:hypothetical protein